MMRANARSRAGWIATLHCLGVTALGCSEKPREKPRQEAPEAASEHPPAEAAPVQVSAAGEASVYDVLGRKPDDGAPSLIMVPQRPPSAAGVRAEGSAFPDFVVFTACGEGYCVDGLKTASSASPPDAVVVAAELTTDERESMGGKDGGWVERGIKVVHVDKETVSYYRAEAWNSPGAAHSNAEFSCRTHRRGAGGGEPARLEDVFGAADARAMREAVQRFLAEQSGQDPPPAIDLGEHDFVVGDAAKSAVFCLPSSVEASDGVARLVRVQL